MYMFIYVSYTFLLQTSYNCIKRPPKHLPKTSSIPPENPPGPGTPNILVISFA